MKDKRISRRRPRLYIPAYDIPNYAAGLLDFLREQPAPGRPKVPDEVKARKLIDILLDIERLKLDRIRSWTHIAERLHIIFPDRYPREREATETGKIMRKSSKLRKDIAEAFVLLQNNAARVRDQRLSDLLMMYERYLAN
jgi:hypothetical protein